MPKWMIALAVLVSTALALTLAVLAFGGPNRGTGGERGRSANNPARLVRPGDDTPSGQPGAEPTARVRLSELKPREGLEGLVIPEFQMVRQDAMPVDQSIFDGGLTILTFIFTNCQLACPPMMGVTTGVAEQLKGTPVRFVSISVDPEHDTPERLAEFAAAYGVDTGRWQFLHGEQAQVEAVLESLYFGLTTDPNPANQIMLASGETMSNILHPTQLLLVGPDRHVVELYGSQIPEQIESLVRRCKSIEW